MMQDTPSSPSEAELPYVSTFFGEVLVEAASDDEAKERAVDWAERNLAETSVVPEGAEIHFRAGTDADGDRFVVPIAGTLNLMEPSQEAADAQTARRIELARHTGPYRYITMGQFQVRSGAPNP